MRRAHLEGQKVLESWKEIASYLQRSTATCQRWEIELGLPIHRLDGTPKARVFAYPEEIDRWKVERLHHAETGQAALAEPPHRAYRRAALLAGAFASVAVLAVLAWRFLPKKPISPPVSDKPMASDADAAAGPVVPRREVDLGRITTHSPEALRSYIAGTEFLLWPSGSEGWRAARAHLNKAIELDPEFAMAYSVLASSFGPGEEQTKNMTKAVELSDLVSRRERLMIQGNHFATIGKDNAKSIQAYLKALKIHPNDDMVNEKLANLYMKVREPKKALKFREFLYRKKRSDRIQLSQYALLCTSLGLYDKGIEAYRFYLEQAPEDADMRKRLYDLFWQSGHYEQALEEADRLRAAGADRNVDKVFPLYLMGNYQAAEQLCKDYARAGGSRSVWTARDWLQNIYITQGQLEKAKEQVILGLQEEEKLVESGLVIEYHGRICLRERLAGLHMIEGKWTDAMDEAEKVWALAVDFKHEYYQVDALTLKAEIYLGMGLADQALVMAEKIRELMQPKTPDAMRFFHLVAGEIELKRGELQKAIESLKKAQGLALLYNQADRISPSYPATLASAYLQTGDLRMARKERERIPLIIFGRMFQGFDYAMNYYILGTICEQLRDRAKAIEYYRRFLDLWKAADPIFPEVKDARARLARLKPS